MKKLASEIGITNEVIDKALSSMKSEENQAKLDKNCKQAIELGAFGLPVTLVHKENDPTWVFGSDRMHIIGYLLGEKEPPILRP